MAYAVTSPDTLEMIVGEQLNLTIDFTGVMASGDVASAAFVDKFINGGFESPIPINNGIVLGSVIRDLSTVSGLPFGWSNTNQQPGSIARLDELAQDGSFESGTVAAVQNAWTLGTPGEFTSVNGAGDSSDNSYSLKATTTRTSVGWNAAQQTVPIDPTQTYAISFYYKQTAGAVQTHFKILYYQDSALTTLSAIRTTDFVLGGTNGTKPWTQVTATISPPTDARYCVLNCMYGYWDGVTGANAQIWFDGVGFQGVNSTPVHSGSHGMTVDFPASGVHYGGIFTTRGVAINPLGGEKVNCTAWMKSVPGSRLFGPFRITYANPGSVISTAGFANGQPSAQALTAVTQIDGIAVTTGWTQFSNTFTTPAGYVWAFMELYANDAVSFPATFYIDDVTMGLGPMVSVYNAAANETVPSAIIGVPNFSSNKMNVTISSANLRPGNTYIATFTATATGVGSPKIVSVLLDIVVVY